MLNYVFLNFQVAVSASSLSYSSSSYKVFSFYLCLEFIYIAMMLEIRLVPLQ
jgi:hypothetical protein